MALNFPDDAAFSSGSGKYFKLNKMKERKVGKEMVKMARGRVVEGFIHGYEGWTEDKKVFRKPTLAELLQTIEEAGKTLRVENDRKNPKQFFAAWWANVEENEVQLWCGTQMSALLQIRDLTKNPEWGDGGDYDITITQGVDAKGFITYTVNPCKPSVLSDKLQEDWARLKAECVGLDALYHNGDPFAAWTEANK